MKEIKGIKAFRARPLADIIAELEASPFAWKLGTLAGIPVIGVDSFEQSPPRSGLAEVPLLA